MNINSLLIFLSLIIPLTLVERAWAISLQTDKIAIVGTGAAGLTAAHTLKKLGYHNITLFEKDDRIGGKIHSLNLQGHTHEAGAVWVFKDYKTILKIAKDFDFKFENYELKKTVLTPEGERVSFLDIAKKKYST